jgi:hypothetical protein
MKYFASFDSDGSLTSVTTDSRPGFFEIADHGAHEIFLSSNGEIQRYLPGQLSLRQARPSQSHLWSNQSMSWVDKTTDAELWALVRSKRAEMLKQSDWSQLPDSRVDKATWAEYRQKLRDITNQPDPRSIAWPTPPG